MPIRSYQREYGVTSSNLTPGGVRCILADLRTGAGVRRLRRGEVAIELGDDQRDVASVEVLGDVDSVAFVIEQVGRGDPITSNLILDVHRPLLSGTHLGENAGRF